MISLALAGVERQPVAAGLALDDVAVVPGIPLERVVAGAEEGDVVARVAVHEVAAVAAEEHLRSAAPPERVVARAAVGGDLDRRAELAGRREAVVAAVGVEPEVLGRPDVDRERSRGDAVEPHARAVGRRGELLAAVAAVDLDGVDAAPPSLRSVSSPGFQTMRSSPASPKTWSSASPPVSVSLFAAAEQRVEAALAEQRVVAGLAEEHVGAGAAGDRVVVAAAEEVRPRQRAVGLVDPDRRRCRPARTPGSRLTLATVGVPPATLTAPPLTSSCARRVAADDDRVGLVVSKYGERAGGKRRGGGRAGRERSCRRSRRPRARWRRAGGARFGFGVRASRLLLGVARVGRPPGRSIPLGRARR